MKSLEYLKSISNSTKLRIVSLLLEGELCVCELEEITSIRQVNISKNLINLKEVGIVDVRRDKQRGFYFLTSDFVSNSFLISHIKELRLKEEILQLDFKKYLHHESIKDENVYVCHAFRNEAS